MISFPQPLHLAMRLEISNHTARLALLLLIYVENHFQDHNGRYYSFFWSSSTRSIQSNKCFSLTGVHPVLNLKRPTFKNRIIWDRIQIPMSYMISNMAPQHEASYEEQRQCARLMLMIVVGCRQQRDPDNQIFKIFYRVYYTNESSDDHVEVTQLKLEPKY